MKLHMWGTRGSLPRAITHQSFEELVLSYVTSAESRGIKTLNEFRNALSQKQIDAPLLLGGHTTCNEIRLGDERLFVDMGSGFAEASTSVLQEGRTHHKIFLSHMHWDHILGLPFFLPIYIAGHTLTIYHVHPKAPEFVRILFNGVNFPVSWNQLAAKIEFKRLKLYEKIAFDGLSVRSFALDHPGGSFGYRFESAKASLAIGVDGEYKRTSREALGKDLSAYQNLDLLVFDGQYAWDELASHHDWGHGSPPIAVELALREGIRNVLITHHDPKASEAKARQMLAQAEVHKAKLLPDFTKTWQDIGQTEGPHLFLAYDGLEFVLAS